MTSLLPRRFHSFLVLSVTFLLFAGFAAPLSGAKDDKVPHASKKARTETVSLRPDPKDTDPKDKDQNKDPKDKSKDEEPWKSLSWRLVGPFRGGRVLAVSGVVNDPNTYYFGGAAGGVWKTTDGGLNWSPIADKDKDKITSVGAIAVSESDPNVIYVGSGEACWRGDIVAGNGVYKSTDAGKSWRWIGLKDSQSIGRVIVHPKNPDIVFVAAMGHAFGPNSERGIFRSGDGGKTWVKVLYKDDRTGAIDIAFDPNNSNILFAAMYEASRTSWTQTSGGPGSGLYRSDDAGATWKRLSGNGLPAGTLGRIGVAVSPNPNRIFALIEAEKGGLFRSDDGGEKWQLINDNRNFRQRAWYYTHIFADPKNADGLYILNTSMWHSTDAGKSFTVIAAPHGDHHGLWIDPNNPKRLINSNDGGATVSTNGGASWTTQDNQPTAQFYHVIADNQFPYRIYGAQQDNTTVAIASRTSHPGIDRTDWYTVGGCESGHIAPDPRDANIVYAGCYGGYISRYNHHNDQEQAIDAWPINTIGSGAAELKYRFQWTAPILLSPHNPGVLYHGAQKLLKSTEAGKSWVEISPDLTRNDKSKQISSGGPITKDNTSVEYYDTIFALAESPLQKDLLWVGTDDGLVQVTQDGGGKWANVTPKDMPEWSRVSSIEPSPFAAGTAYVASNHYQMDDFAPYIFKTTNFGQTWSRINSDLPDRAFVRVVREDPKRKGLLFAGTEEGVFVSLDDGAHWRSLQRNLPVTTVHDLIVKDDDLVVATHGRAFWILDDISPLREYTPDVTGADAFLFKPAISYRAGGGVGRGGNIGQNPAYGAVIYYNLKEAIKKPDDAGDKASASEASATDVETAKAEHTETSPKQSETTSEGKKPEPMKSAAADLTLEVLDNSGKVVRKFPPKKLPGEGDESEGPGGGSRPSSLTAEAGLNRFVWNLRAEDASRVPAAPLWGGSTQGPVVAPGLYQVRLTVKGKSYTAPLEVRKDPRVATSQEDLQKQYDLSIKIRDRVTQVHDAINQIRNVRAQVTDLNKRLVDNPQAKAVIDAGKALDGKLTPLEEALIQRKTKSGQDMLNYGLRLNNQLVALGGEVESSDSAPTAAAYQVFDMLNQRAEVSLTAWKTVMENEIKTFNALVKQQDIPTLILSSTPLPATAGSANAEEEEREGKKEQE